MALLLECDLCGNRFLANRNLIPGTFVREHTGGCLIVNLMVNLVITHTGSCLIVNLLVNKVKFHIILLQLCELTSGQST